MPCFTLKWWQRVPKEGCCFLDEIGKDELWQQSPCQPSLGRKACLPGQLPPGAHDMPSCLPNNLSWHYRIHCCKKTLQFFCRHCFTLRIGTCKMRVVLQEKAMMLWPLSVEWGADWCIIRCFLVFPSSDAYKSQAKFNERWFSKRTNHVSLLS